MIEFKGTPFTFNCADISEQTQGHSHSELFYFCHGKKVEYDLNVTV